VLICSSKRKYTSYIQTKISKISKNFLKLLSIIVYLTTFFALSLSLSFARWLVVGGGVKASLSLEKSVSFLSDDVAFVVVFVLLLFQSFFRFIF
jgi:hypothetical protein